MFNINFAVDWIRTADLWYHKQLLYQLSHNHCPYVIQNVFVIENLIKTFEYSICNIFLSRQLIFSKQFFQNKMCRL